MFSIRKETKKDHLEVERLIYKVLKTNDDAPCYEHYKICKLRGTKDFNKELTFVAEELGKIIGFVTLSNAVIKNEKEEIPTLLLRPIVVHEDYQRKGVGKTLLKAVINEAKFLGYKHIFVYGEKEYFSKFGFTSLGAYEIFNEEGKKEKNMLVIQFKTGALNDVKGKLIISSSFKDVDQNEFEYYHHALHAIKENKEIKTKNIKKIAFFCSLFFTLLAVIFFILKNNNIISNDLGLGMVVMAITGCFASISVSHFSDKQLLMGTISASLTAILFILGLLIIF